MQRIKLNYTHYDAPGENRPDRLTPAHDPLKGDLSGEPYAEGNGWHHDYIEVEVPDEWEVGYTSDKMPALFDGRGRYMLPRLNRTEDAVLFYAFHAGADSGREFGDRPDFSARILANTADA